MSAILQLFDILSLIYVFRSLQLTAAIWREWKTLTQEPLTQHKESQAEQASFFIAVPIGVLLHELGHALATWASGGHVVQFGYRVFWGFVLPQGHFTLAQNWFISLAGTLGSLVFGVAVWLLLKSNKSSALRYFGLRAFRFQVFFALVYYPVFTLLGFEGDWRTIYDFRATPLLAGITAVFHLLILLIFWQGERTGWFERPSQETVAEQAQFRALQTSAAANAHDMTLQLQYIDTLRRGGAINQARRVTDALLRQSPDSGAAYLQLALLQTMQRRHISSRASRHLQKALSLGLPTPSTRAYAHQLLGKYYLDKDQPQDAMSQIDEALAQNIVGEETAVARHKAALHYLRSQAHRRQQQYQQAYQDIQQAIALAQQVGDDKLTAHYRDEQTIIENHAGRKLSNHL